jgi:hypothetical protein
MGRKPAPKPDDPAQSKRFIEAAEEVGADTDDELWSERSRRLFLRNGTLRGCAPSLQSTDQNRFEFSQSTGLELQMSNAGLVPFSPFERALLSLRPSASLFPWRGASYHVSHMCERVGHHKRVALVFVGKCYFANHVAIVCLQQRRSNLPNSTSHGKDDYMAA